MLENHKSALSALRAEPNNRNLGYMHYRHSSGTIYSIFCTVDEWYLDDILITSKIGTIGTMVEVAAWIASLYVIPQAVAADFISNLIANGILVLASSLVTASVTTSFYGNEIQQIIYGVETSPSSSRSGNLGRATLSYMKASGNKSYSQLHDSVGYTTHLWGTGELGRRMFYQVFGIEYTPTSWTGV